VKPLRRVFAPECVCEAARALRCRGALVWWPAQFEFTARLHDASAAARDFETKRVLELQDALRRYVIFQSSLLANCQVMDVSACRLG
jgi:hypothetical protein